jgi:hypothetical protein
MLAWVLGRLPSGAVIQVLCALCREAIKRWPSLGEDDAITIRSLASISFRKLSPEEVELGRTVQRRTING